MVVAPLDHHLCSQGWLRFDDAQSITCVEAVRVAVFGTTTGGFVVKTSGETLYFECVPVHAAECVECLFALLATA